MWRKPLFLFYACYAVTSAAADESGVDEHWRRNARPLQSEITAGKLDADGNYNAALLLRREAYKWRKRHQGPDHWQTRDAKRALEFVELRQQLTTKQWSQLRLGSQLHDKMFVALKQEEYLEAIEQGQQVRALVGEVLGQEHLKYADATANLAMIYKSMGQTAAAEALYKEAILIEKAVLGDPHPDHTKSLSALASLYSDLGNHAQAEPLYKEVVSNLWATKGKKHLEYAEGLHNLALNYCFTSQYELAEPLYKEALAIKQESLGEKHTKCAATLMNLAVLYQRIGKFSQAEALYKEAAEINKAALGVTDPEYVVCVVNLADLYRKMGHDARAKSLIEESQALRQKALGKKSGVQEPE